MSDRELDRAWLIWCARTGEVGRILALLALAIGAAVIGVEAKRFKEAMRVWDVPEP